MSGLGLKWIGGVKWDFSEEETAWCLPYLCPTYLSELCKAQIWWKSPWSEKDTVCRQVWFALRSFVNLGKSLNFPEVQVYMVNRMKKKTQILLRVNSATSLYLTPVCKSKHALMGNNLSWKTWNVIWVERLGMGRGFDHLEQLVFWDMGSR